MKMKKSLLTMLALLFMGSGAFAQGTLDVPEVARKAGPVKQVVVLESKKEGTVKIRLTGTENYRDLQFDIKLPAGMTAADGKVVIGTDHVVASAVQASEDQTSNAQTVRFVLYSTSGANLSNDILLEIPVKIAEGVDVATVNEATATLSNVHSSNAVATSLDVAGTTFPFSVMKLGDVDDDNEIALNDAIYIARFTVEGNPQPFVEEVADYDGKDGIALNDAIEVARSTVTDNDSASSKQILDIEESFVNDMDPE